MKLSMTAIGTERWFGGDIFATLDLISMADRRGFDILSLPEHVVMGKDISAYPYTKGLFSAETDFYEPLILAAHYAARTERMRFCTSVLLAPLRPAVYLAKLVATLDVLSRGRVDLGVGVGWQKFEYDAQGIPWDGRFSRLIETVEACRLLWTQAPATYHGKHVNFTEAYSKPFPVQKGGIPILFGIAPTDLGVQRIVKHADGWCPLNLSLEQVESAMARIRAQAKAVGRDMSNFRLKLPAPMAMKDGKPDLEATLAGVPRLKALGCTEVHFVPAVFCTNAKEYEQFLDKVATARAGW